jgi:hypothetical protein
MEVLVWRKFGKLELELVMQPSCMGCDPHVEWRRYELRCHGSHNHRMARCLHGDGITRDLNRLRVEGWSFSGWR